MSCGCILAKCNRKMRESRSQILNFLSLSQGSSAIGAGGKRVDERGQRTELTQPSAHDPTHHQSHPLVREVSDWLLLIILLR